MNKELKLIKYIESQIGVPFKYGKNDCPAFIAGAIDAMHGTNLRKKYTGLWHDQKSAWKYAKKNGSLAEQLKKLGCKPIEFPFIQTGDIIIMEQKLAHEKKWHSAAVFTSSKVAIITDVNGVEIIPLSKVPNICEVLRWL
jgi:hypothetical protein